MMLIYVLLVVSGALIIWAFGLALWCLRLKNAVKELTTYSIEQTKTLLNLATLCESITKQSKIDK